MSSLILDSVWDITLEYIIYAIVIIICIGLLILIRKHNKLPKHSDFKKKLLTLHGEIEMLAKSATGESGYGLIKNVSRALYRTGRLGYTATVMAEKERIGELGKIAAALDNARGELVNYKYGRREKADTSGLLSAAEYVSGAIGILDVVIERSDSIRARKENKY